MRTSGDGTVPVAGNSGAGWVDGAASPALPRVLNPASGYVASSNNEIDRSLGVRVTRDWAAPYRAMRLHEVLSAGRGLGIEQMTTLQNDTRSASAARLLAGVNQALATAKTDRARRRLRLGVGGHDRFGRVEPVVLLEVFNGGRQRGE